MKCWNERSRSIETNSRAPERRVKKTGKASGADKQLDLFAHVDKPEMFVKAVKERADWYQRQAGGDLHYGTVAGLLTSFRTSCWSITATPSPSCWLAPVPTGIPFTTRTLIQGASAILQKGTIGTDLRVVYDPTAHKAHVDIVPFHRNRKEQGAYYTDETLCRWLVERTLGELYGAWGRVSMSF